MALTGIHHSRSGACLRFFPMIMVAAIRRMNQTRWFTAGMPVAKPAIRPTANAITRGRREIYHRSHKGNQMTVAQEIVRVVKAETDAGRPKVPLADIQKLGNFDSSSPVIYSGAQQLTMPDGCLDRERINGVFMYWLRPGVNLSKWLNGASAQTQVVRLGADPRIPPPAIDPACGEVGRFDSVRIIVQAAVP